MESRLILCLAVLSLGCSDSTGPDRDPVGTYEMVALLGKPLPYQSEGLVLGGELVLKSDDWTGETRTRRVDGQISTAKTSGFYEHHGPSIAFTDGGGVTLMASYDGALIRMPARDVITGKEGTADFRRH